MSMPLEPQVIQPPPPYLNQQEDYTAHSGGFGHVGPLIAVLAVITILGVVAGMVGRLCAGRSIMGYGQYDFEGWMERKCASCIDGRIESPPLPPPSQPQPNANGGAGDSFPVAMPMDNPEATTTRAAASKQADGASES